MIEKIYIPTMGRADVQITYDNLPEKYRKMVMFVVPYEERDDYGKYDRKQILATDKGLKGIARTREFICRVAGKIRFSMIDDDVIFYRRNQKYYSDYGKKSNMSKSKRQLTEEDFDEMFELFNKWMDEGYIHIGHRRANLPPLNKSHNDISFFNSIHHINGNLLSKIIDDINWTLCEVGEDANFMFEYLSRGFINRKSCEFPAHWDSFQEGGCAVYRDAKFHNSEHRKLQKKWGEEVVKSKEMMAQGTYGHNIGVIHEFSYKPKKIRKRALFRHGMENDVMVNQPKKVFNEELGEKLK
tara:strand:+ start:492 stop:1385 length:894 start_codon:yes stop_codon:yes gene_type:complete